jgi:hypothetical protein
MNSASTNFLQNSTFNPSYTITILQAIESLNTDYQTLFIASRGYEAYLWNLDTVQTSLIEVQKSIL